MGGLLGRSPRGWRLYTHHRAATITAFRQHDDNATPDVGTQATTLCAIVGIGQAPRQDSIIVKLRPARRRSVHRPAGIAVCSWLVAAVIQYQSRSMHRWMNARVAVQSAIANANAIIAHLVDVLRSIQMSA